jgi:hypothetical protein
MTVMARASSNYKRQTIPSSEGMLHKDYDRKGLVEKQKKKLMAVSLKGLGSKTN